MMEETDFLFVARMQIFFLQQIKGILIKKAHHTD
jgi:hypothetical protein